MSATTRGNGQRGAVAYDREPEPPRQDTHELLERVVEATAQERHSLEEVKYLAKAAESSGFYGMTQAQAFTLMMLAEADGRHPMHALRRYHLMEFKGRVTPTMRAEAMLADMMAVGWRHEWTTENDDRDKQEIFLRHPVKCPNGKTVKFSEKDAWTAGLLDGGNRENWQKHRTNMLRARVVSNACRMLDPGIVLGVYTPEETADMGAEQREAIAPATRDRPGLRSALDDARRPREAPAPAPAPEPVEAPPPQTFAQWLAVRLAKFNEECREKIGGRSAQPIDPMAGGQVTNALISAWLAEGGVRDEDVKNGRGARDRSKMAAVIAEAWAKDRESLAAEVDEYLEGKLKALADERGVSLDQADDGGDAPDERQGMADEDPAEEAPAN